MNNARILVTLLALIWLSPAHGWSTYFPNGSGPGAPIGIIGWPWGYGQRSCCSGGIGAPSSGHLQWVMVVTPNAGISDIYATNEVPTEDLSSGGTGGAWSSVPRVLPHYSQSWISGPETTICLQWTNRNGASEEQCDSDGELPGPRPVVCTVTAADIVIDGVKAMDANGTVGSSIASVDCSGEATVTVSAGSADGLSTIDLGNGGLLRGVVTVGGAPGEPGVILHTTGSASTPLELVLHDGSGGRTPAGVYHGQVVVKVTVE